MNRIARRRKPAGGRAFLVVEHLDVGEPGRVVNGNVHVLATGAAAPGRPVGADTSTVLSSLDEDGEFAGEA